MSKLTWKQKIKLVFEGLSVRLDNPEEDKTFKYPKEVQELIEEERRRRHRG